MIDHDMQHDDPIVAEVRRIREQIAAEFDFDLNAIFDEMRRRQETSGRNYITREPRRITPPAAPQST